MCANNYLGLANHPELVRPAQEPSTAGDWLASVRFICGTSRIHKRLETKLSEFLATEDTILYTSCFDANGGCSRPPGEEDCIISDALNHAASSTRPPVQGEAAALCELRHARPGEAAPGARESRFRMIATDGVFSMDGSIAP